MFNRAVTIFLILIAIVIQLEIYTRISQDKKPKILGDTSSTQACVCVGGLHENVHQLGLEHNLKMVVVDFSNVDCKNIYELEKSYRKLRRLEKEHNVVAFSGFDQGEEFLDELSKLTSLSKKILKFD